MAVPASRLHRRLLVHRFRMMQTTDNTDSTDRKQNERSHFFIPLSVFIGVIRDCRNTAGGMSCRA
jgi:hypothetical protein